MKDEETFKKIFLLLGSPNEGERVAAFHQLFVFMEKRGLCFKDLLMTLTDNVPRTVYAELEQNYTAIEREYNELDSDYATLEREFAALKVVLWIRTNWRHIAGAFVLLAGFAAGYEFWPDATAAERQEVDAALNTVAERASFDTGYSTPTVHVAGSVPYWSILFGETVSDEQADADGKPVTLQCLHLYASPATVKPTLPDSPSSSSSRLSGSAARVRDAIYMKPSPFNWVGWLQWPQRALVCRRAPTKEASR